MLEFLVTLAIIKNKMITDILKLNTRQYHDEIENKLKSNRLFDGTFTQEDYYKMLLVNHQFIKVYEDQILSLLHEEDIEFLKQLNFKKLELIEKDLAELHLEPYKSTVVNDLENRAQALGALYVIEGSMLGGMVISKQLKKYPELAESSFNYFGHYGHDLGPIWKAFVNYLNSNVTAQDQQLEVLNGAIKAYQTLIVIAH